MNKELYNLITSCIEKKSSIPSINATDIDFKTTNKIINFLYKQSINF